MAETSEQRRVREAAEVAAALTDALGRDDAGMKVALERIANKYRGRLAETAPRWAPTAWKRDRVRFRALVLTHVQAWGADWSKDRATLTTWLAEVESVGDAELFRRLYGLELAVAQVYGDARSVRIQADLLARWRKAADRGARAAILVRFDLYYTLTEATAIALWEREPDLARDYLITRLPTAFSWRSLGTEPVVWTDLWARSEHRDPALFRALYRAQVPFARWKADVLRIVAATPDARQLNDALIAIHTPIHGDRLGLVWAELLDKRGRDVVPYVAQHLSALRTWSGEGHGWRAVTAIARKKEWLDLWVQLVAIGGAANYDAEIKALVVDTERVEAEVRRRIVMLGTGVEGISLTDDTATALYGRFPDVAHEVFRARLVAQEPVKLLRAALTAGDAVLLDVIASRFVLRYWKVADAVLEPLVAHYEALPDGEFARRAGAILGERHAHEVWAYSAMIRANPLAHLLFERNVAKYLDEPTIVRDLLESPLIHVQGLALRVLAHDDARARAIATDSLDQLVPMLLRPLHRRTRLWAFVALENAVTDLDGARRVVSRARDALDLPDDHYPKEALIGVIGRLLHRWPELRTASEHPRVFRAVA